MRTCVRNGSSVFGCLLTLLVTLPAAASDLAPPTVESPERHFGDAGVLGISGATQLSLTHTTLMPTGPGQATTGFFVATAADFFVLRGLSIGVGFHYDHLVQPGFPSASGISFGPRVGYNVPIGEHASFWPVASADYSANWGAGEPPMNSLAFGVYAPVLYHPGPHFYLGLGPDVSLTVITSNASSDSGEISRVTEYGVLATVGGWVGL